MRNEIGKDVLAPHFGSDTKRVVKLM